MADTDAAGAMARISGTLGGALLAMDFVTEPETWPVFAAWVTRNSPVECSFGEAERAAMIETMGYLDQVFGVAQQRAGRGSGS